MILHRTFAVLLLTVCALPAQESRPSRDLRDLAREAARAKKTLLVRASRVGSEDLGQLDAAIESDPALAQAFQAAFLVETWQIGSPEGGDPDPRIMRELRGAPLGLALIDRAGGLMSRVDPSTWKTDGKWDRARIAAFVEFWAQPAPPDDRVARAKLAYGPIYDPEADALADIDAAAKKAKAEGKHVLVMVGGNWCHWCYLLHVEFERRPELKAELGRSYVLLHVSWEPERRNEKAMARLDQPWRFGFPVLVVLDGDGKRLHTQDSGQLESGDQHDVRRVLKFLEMWSPTGLEAPRQRR
jgi:hypothetical protein